MIITRRIISLRLILVAVIALISIGAISLSARGQAAAAPAAPIDPSALAANVTRVITLTPTDDARAQGGSPPTQTFPSGFLYFSTLNGHLVFIQFDLLTLPANASGRIPAVTSLAVDRDNADVLYVGTDGQGIYRLSDKGTTLVALGTALYGARVDQIVLAPQDVSSLYAVTSRGLFESRDAGQSWERVTTLPEQAVTLAIAPSNHEILYAGTASMGAYRSEDGGRTWQAVELPLPSGYEGGRLSVGLPTFFGAGKQDGLLPVQYQPQSGRAESACIIYASHDGGRSWQATAPVRNGGASDFISASEGWIWAAEPHNTGSAAPVTGTLYRTRDGAQTWEALPGTPGLDAFLQHGGDVLQLDFVSAETGWAIVRGADGRTTQLLKTQDGGRSWDPIGGQIGESEPVDESMVDG